MTREPPYCRKCGQEHWRFKRCETVAAATPVEPEPAGGSKDSPDLFQPWTERDIYLPFGERGRNNPNFGGSLTILPRKAPTEGRKR